MDYQKSLFVTMDLDGACDGVVRDTLDLIDRSGIPVTLFVTHATPLLERMRSDPLISLGIHPDFLPQLKGETSVGFEQTLDDLLKIVPEAGMVHCHAGIDAEPILAACAARGIKKDLNLFMPFSSGMDLKVFRHFTGVLRVPCFFNDKDYLAEETKFSAEEHICGTWGVKVFNFHPIHLFLNTENMERYQKIRPFEQDYDQLKNFVNPDPENGTRAFYNRIRDVSGKLGYEFKKLDEI